MAKELLKQLYRKRVLIFSVLLIFWSGVASADLTKQDVEEIRKIVRGEIQGVDKRIDELKADLKAEIKDVRSEIKEVRSEIKDVRSEIKDVRRELKDFMLWGFGTLFVGMLTLVGFVLWDRRSALAPAIRKNKEFEDRQDRLERVLKEYAFKNPEMREILKGAGIL